MSSNGDGSELWIVINHWDRFQHYRDRDPPWIKNYPRLLSDDNYLELTPHRRALLHGLWLEYARSSCALRAHTRRLSRALNMQVTRSDLESLNHAGFIHLSASKPLAPRYHDASASRVRVETETEEEKQRQDQEQDLKRVSKSPSTYDVAREQEHDGGKSSDIDWEDQHLPRAAPPPEMGHAFNGVDLFAPGGLPEKETR